MPGPSKRARTITVDEENALPTPPPTTRHTRRTSAVNAASALTTSTAAPTIPPTSATTTPTRPIQTRSSTLSLAPPTPLTRTSSLFSPTTRRATASAHLAALTPSRGAGEAGPSRGGALVRTQSTPALSSPTDLKQGVASGSGGGGRGKGDPEDVFDGPGRRFGKGKENVPPKKDSPRDEGESSSRKRLRVSPRTSASGSGSGRGRSGSVASVRSESSSGPNSLFSRRSTVFPSLSPSPSNATSQSADSASSIDPLDLLSDEMDVDKTPTKRPVARRGVTLPTPPSSSTSLADEVRATGRRIQLFRMNSSLSTISTATETDADLPAETPIKAKNAYKHLKSFLRLSSSTAKSTSADVIGREDEKAVLRSYFSLRSAHDVGLYVSGPPGTGKTALVTAIGREMALEGWNVVEIGCMGVKTGSVWTMLAEQLGCDRSEEGVQAAIAQIGKNTLIVLDEVDSLLPPAPAAPTPATSHLLSRLFSLPLLSTPSSTIKFIAISNTLDLTVRARLVLPTGTQPQVLPFRAYGTAEMIDIINSRVAAASVDRADAETVKVDLKAIELLTRKVEAQNGDLRMCLASLTSAVNLAEAEWVKKTFTSESDQADTPAIPLVKIALPHVIKAFTSHTQQLKAAAGSAGGAAGSPTSRKIRSVPLQGKMVLVSILIYLSRCRVGLPGCPSAANASTPTNSPHKHGDLSTSTLYATYSYLLSHTSSPFPPAAESDYRDLLSNLETLGLVSLYGNGSSAHMSRSSSANARKGAAGPRVELCVPEEDVKLGLGLGAVKQGGMADEEVGKVWDREEARVDKAREKIARAVEVLAGVERDE